VDEHTSLPRSHQANQNNRTMALRRFGGFETKLSNEKILATQMRIDRVADGRSHTLPADRPVWTRFKPSFVSRLAPSLVDRYANALRSLAVFGHNPLWPRMADIVEAPRVCTKLSMSRQAHAQS
jgi:hypothetical protein